MVKESVGVGCSHCHRGKILPSLLCAQCKSVLRGKEVTVEGQALALRH